MGLQTRSILLLWLTQDGFIDRIDAHWYLFRDFIRILYDLALVGRAGKHNQPEGAFETAVEDGDHNLVPS